MSLEENKAVVRRLIEALNAQDVCVLDDISTAEFAERFAGVIESVHGAFEGHQAAIDDLVAEGDKVWVRLSTSGRHSGAWAGVQPTGRQWTATGVYFVRLANGKAAGLEVLFDRLSQVEQLGATIALPA